MSNLTPLDFTVAGTIDVSWTSIMLRDTDYSCVVMFEEAVPDIDVFSCPKVRIENYLGSDSKFHLVRCYISCPYYNG